MAKFKGPKGITSVSLGGETYNVDKKGCITLPDGVDGGPLGAFGFRADGAEVVDEAPVEAAADAAPTDAGQAAPEAPAA